jgi:limonene-1,2-epoxide hydrolase
MFTKLLLVITTIFLFSGCVERGYDLTVNDTTHTVTAVKSVDIHKDTQADTKKDIDIMTKAVNKTQVKHIKQTSSKHKTTTSIKKSDHTNVLEKETKAHQIAAEKKRVLLEEKINADKMAQLQKEKALQTTKEENEKKALAKKFAIEKAIRERQAKAAKTALEQKIAKEKALQLEKEKTLQATKEESEKKALAKKFAIEKAIRERQAQMKKAEAAKKKPIQTTAALNFQPSTQTYQKFGTSEIHGHVVYLTPSGQEIALRDTKVYLVPKNTTTDYWYNNYYLKNKDSSSLSKSIVHYINATHLDLDKNFAFYGLAAADYYVIIESSYPKSIAPNKKVYIAKKINVKKYKKIMTVFSKRL